MEMRRPSCKGVKIAKKNNQFKFTLKTFNR